MTRWMNGFRFRFLSAGPIWAPAERSGVAQLRDFLGAKGGSRTPTSVTPLEPESSASASSATFA